MFGETHVAVPVSQCTASSMVHPCGVRWACAILSLCVENTAVADAHFLGTFLH